MELHTNEETFHGYHIQLEGFEGPLDLLLHLIKENKMDIYNIQISLITHQYLDTLQDMKELNLEVAGEFLVMAATLAHIKSKMLLPVEPEQEDPTEEGKDPRDELVRRLLQYQKYKHAAEQLWLRPTLGRDVFVREQPMRVRPPLGQQELAEVSIFKLVNLFAEITKKLERKGLYHNISREAISIQECVYSVVASIRQSTEGTLRFQDLLQPGISKRRVVVTFLAVLNLIKVGAIRIFQNEEFSDIQLIGNQVIYDADWTYNGIDEYDAPADQDDFGVAPLDGREAPQDGTIH